MQFSKKTNAPAIFPFVLVKKFPVEKLRAMVLKHQYKVVELRGANTVLLTHPDSVSTVMMDEVGFMKIPMWVSDHPLAALADESLLVCSGDMWK